MTREEAIASYEKLYAYMVGDDDAIELDYGEFMELNHYIRSALRTVSREQVEKEWRGEWMGSGDGYADGELVYDTWTCSECGHVIDEEDDPDMLPQFCPKCYAAMTDEAVEMVMDRLEALQSE